MKNIFLERACIRAIYKMAAKAVANGENVKDVHADVDHLIKEQIKLYEKLSENTDTIERI